MNGKSLIFSGFVLLWAIAPSTAIGTTVEKQINDRTATIQTELQDNLPQKMCVDKDGNQYPCP